MRVHALLNIVVDSGQAWVNMPTWTSWFSLSIVIFTRTISISYADGADTVERETGFNTTILIGIFFGVLIVTLIIVFVILYLIDHFKSRGSQESRGSGDSKKSRKSNSHERRNGHHHHKTKSGKSSLNGLDGAKVPKSNASDRGLHGVVVDGAVRTPGYSSSSSSKTASSSSGSSLGPAGLTGSKSKVASRFHDSGIYEPQEVSPTEPRIMTTPSNDPELAGHGLTGGHHHHHKHGHKKRDHHHKDKRSAKSGAKDREKEEAEDSVKKYDEENFATQPFVPRLKVGKRLLEDKGTDKPYDGNTYGSYDAK